MFNMNFFTEEQYKYIVREKMQYVLEELSGILIVDGNRYRTPPKISDNINDITTPKTSQDFMSIGINNELYKIYYEEPKCASWSNTDISDTMKVEVFNFENETNIPYFHFFNIYDFTVENNKEYLIMDSYNNFLSTIDGNLWTRDIYGQKILKYIVNTKSKKCTCPGFKYTKKCKHLDSRKRKTVDEIEELTKKMKNF